MRLVVLDTETTGLEIREGHRVIEIGCVEIVNRRHTQNRFHAFINPERSIDVGALEVHGITEDFLADKPVFTEIIVEFINFISGAEVIIHNAPFDLSFLNSEFERAREKRRLDELCTVTDSLQLARQLHPGQRNSLDALCRRYDVDNAERTLHGALLDAEILADVYLAMTGGQSDISFETPARHSGQRRVGSTRDASGSVVEVVRASPQELKEHQRWIELLGEHCVWTQTSNDPD